MLVLGCIRDNHFLPFLEKQDQTCRQCSPLQFINPHSLGHSTYHIRISNTMMKMKFSMRKRKVPKVSKSYSSGGIDKLDNLDLDQLDKLADADATTRSNDPESSTSSISSSKSGSTQSILSYPLGDTAPVEAGRTLLRGAFGTDMASVRFDTQERIQKDMDAITLSQEFPDATLEECIRFRALRPLAPAREKLNKYLEWRSLYQLDQIPSDQFQRFTNDVQIWDFAVAHALKSTPGLKLKEQLPRFLRFVGRDVNMQYNQSAEGECQEENCDFTRSKSGKRIILILSALIDSRIAPLEFYALVFAMYLNIIFDRHSLEDVVGVGDVRKGKGWRNASPAKIIPFVKHLVRQMDQFPERMNTLYVLPVPSLAKGIWHFIRGFLKASVVDRVDIHWGSSSLHSSAPKTLLEFFDQSAMDDFERNRRSEFC